MFIIVMVETKMLKIQNSKKNYKSHCKSSLKGSINNNNFNNYSIYPIHSKHVLCLMYSNMGITLVFLYCITRALCTCSKYVQLETCMLYNYIDNSINMYIHNNIIILNIYSISYNHIYIIYIIFNLLYYINYI